MSYNLIGKFYEACDCEVICSCWAGVTPDMGSCTGLFVWHITDGSVDNIDVSGSKVVILSSGKSCDDSDYMLMLVDGKLNELKTAFNQSGPWRSVFQAQSFLSLETPVVPKELVVQTANVTINDQPGQSITIKVTASSVKIAELNFTVKPVKIEGKKGENLLINRVVGSAMYKDVTVGVVDTPAAPSKSGLNLLADIFDPKDNSLQYTFDLDISRVTAVRGNFQYVQK